MAHKTITISEDAYNSLNKLKRKNESFTDVILRITMTEKNIDDLINWIKRNKGNQNLADSISTIFDERNTVELRNF